MRVDRIAVCSSLALAVCLWGCSRTSTPPPAPPATQQATTQPAAPLKPPGPDYRRVSTLLDFETDGDVLFVTTEPATALQVGATHSRSGERSLVIPAGTRRAVIKLASLVSGREFPGVWTLVGLHLRATAPTGASVYLIEKSQPRPARVVSLPAEQWIGAMLDLVPLRQSASVEDMLLAVDFGQPVSDDVLLDDVLLADNVRALVSPDDGAAADAWTIRRDGFTWIVDRPNRFRLALPTDDMAAGWRMVEATRIRTMLHSDAGKTKSLTIYHDGRSYWDGAFKPLSLLDGAPEFDAQHQQPAGLTIPQDQGRLDRNTPGDANHDGYNESTGAYQLVAAGRRMEVTLAPRAGSLLRPVVEVRNLPPGDVRATLEGTLAAEVLRLPDGRCLMVLPGRIQRPAVLDIRVK